MDPLPPDIPVLDVHVCGTPVPDLRRLPRERWRDALERVHFPVRLAASQELSDDEREEAQALVAETFFEHGDLPRRPTVARATPRLPRPSAPPRRDLRGVQVNVRLRRDQHAELVEAAELVGLTPTALARAFIMDGTHRLLDERDRR